VAKRTPLHGGPIVAVVWIVGQVILWTVVVACTALLSLVLIALVVGILDPTNWNGAHS
jgi:hypothetical protein